MPTTLSLYNMVLLLDLPLMYTIILTVFVYYLKFFFFFLGKLFLSAPRSDDSKSFEPSTLHCTSKSL